MQPDRLSARVRRLIKTGSRYDQLLLSSISLWEFCKLLEKGRLAISCEPERWMERALDMPKLQVQPITPAIALHSTTLPLPFHGDPADQLIAATARELNITLLTKDTRILDYPHVRTYW